ncbi:hypothetical protein PVK06_007071 [Gossypium arboreum]|uniref:CCHC-type domain-containing protein n=1 Tax=Gossypium arboreum TaxID=29729 RepID=A0ABR0QHG5_GOSAR|nr:hypothetical protein PVK06_007071 [Gossypium arboreum]
MVDGTVQQVEYEALPTVCFTCGKYGHVKELCPTVMVDHTWEQPTNMVVEAQGGIGGRPNAAKRPEFSPRMLVECKARRGQRSRFSALNQVGDLRCDLRVVNEDFMQEKVGERGVVSDGRLKVRVNKGVNENSGPNLEAGRKSVLGYGAFLGPTKGISLDNLVDNHLGQKSNFSLDKFLGKRPMELSSKGKGNEQEIYKFIGTGMEGDNQNSLNFGVSKNITSSNLERVKAHFNPAFEMFEGVEIQIFEGVLDPEKHSAMSFKESISSDQGVKSGIAQ